MNVLKPSSHRDINVSKILNEFLGPKFLLVIEPTQNYRGSIRNYLYHLKIKNVRFVSNIAEAKREMLAIQVGIFVAEWKLPEKNGLLFCRELRKDSKHKNTPFLLTGTENLRQDVILASEGGITNYLLKPFSFGDFSAQLGAMVLYQKEPSHFNLLLERIESHIEAQEDWIAESLIREALSIKPNSARALCCLGRIEIGKKDYVKASSYFREAIAKNPDFVEAYKYLLQAAEMTSDYHGMLKAGALLHEKSPDNPRYPLIIAVSHMELGNLTESEMYFKIAIKLSPALADGYRGLGTVFLQKKEFAKSEVQWEKALDLDKDDVSTLNSLAVALMKQNLIEEALEKFKLALSINMNDPRIWFNVGLTYLKKNDQSSAKAAFQKAINLDPTFTKAQRNLNRLNNQSQIAQANESDQSLEFSKFNWKRSA